MIKAILFDFWGTLVDNGVQSPIKQVKDILEINLPFSEYVTRMERAMMTSEFPDLREAFKKIFEEFGLEENENKMEELVGMWNKSWMLAKPYPEVKEALLRLKENYLLVLISNTDCFSIEKVLKKFQWDSLFDKFFFSYQMGMIKTDKIFFDKVLEELDLGPEECLMIGDSIQSDIMPAKDKGIKVLLMDRNDRRDFDQKIRSLEEVDRYLR